MTENAVFDDRDLHRLVDRAACELTGAGIGPGEPVVLCLPNGVRWIATYLALARIGAVSVPLNAGSAVEEVAHVLDDCQARLALLTEPLTAVLAERFPDRQLWPDGRATGGQVGGDAPAAPERAATIAYTSGTTGRQKGTIQSRVAVDAGGATLVDRLGLGPADVIATALPLAHAYGTNVFNAAWSSGATLVLQRRFDGARLLEAAHRWQVSVLAGVPTMYRRLLPAPEVAVPSGVRCAVSAGEAAGAELARTWERTVGGAFVEGWGMTELAGFAALATPDLAGRHGTAGTAVPGVQLRVDSTGPFGDPTTGIGQLQVSGPVVTPGYLDSAIECLGPEGWLHTGDIGSIDAAGRVRIAGRCKEVILSGGFTVHPAEVERVIGSHPDIREVAVAGVPDPVFGETVCAWIVPRPGASPTSEHLAEYCRERLAGYKVPRQTVAVSALPLNSTGKVSRRHLPVRYPVTVREPA
ncbi:class I adenylate-forming enzyme family protein [Nocardia goodfellowii]